MTGKPCGDAEQHTPSSLADVLERDYFPMPHGARLYLNEYEWRMVIAALRAAPPITNVEAQQVAGAARPGKVEGGEVSRLERLIHGEPLPNTQPVASPAAASAPSSIEYMEEVSELARYWANVDLGVATKKRRPTDCIHLAREVLRLSSSWSATVQQESVQNDTAPLSDNYIQDVPDKCDRIIWRGRYYHLPLSESVKPDTAKVPEGWKLVPSEITGEMAMAMELADPPHNCSIREYHQAMWTAALVAAPSPSGVEEG